MLTVRGWWIFITSLLLSIVTVTGAWSPVVAVLSLTVLTAVVLEWLLFAFRVRSTLRFLHVERSVTQAGRTVTSGWAGVLFQVKLVVVNRGRCRLPLVFARDLISNPDALGDSRPEINAVLPPSEAASVEYTLHSRSPGLLHFAGVRVTVTDLSGLFTARAFVPAETTITVLPPLTDSRGRQRADKRYNTLPPPGLHRMRRPGSGSELLDLRDYRPGDPPKMIAWKPTARRDRLITREFESDVPIRCLLFLDASNAVRVNTTGAQLVTTAAGILQAATSNRDLVGLTIFDEHHAEVVAPGRTSSHTIHLLHDLSLAAARLPDCPETDPDRVVSFVEPLMQERSPEAFLGTNTSKPWGHYWRPLLDHCWGWVIFLPMLLTPLLISQSTWLDLTARTARNANPGTGKIFVDFPIFMLVFLTMLMLPSALALLFWLAYGLLGFLPGNRRRVRQRKQVATVLALEDGGSPSLLERYLKDDVAFNERAGRWLAARQVRIPATIYEADGKLRYRGESKLATLSRAMMRAVSRARDNELYVILADVVELTGSLDVVTRAVKLARTRHHQVLIVVPWPDAIPTKPLAFDQKQNDDCSLDKSVANALQKGHQRKYDALRSELTRAGAIVIRHRESDPVRVVLDHLDRLRGARSLR
ncbi:hypothetical protein BH11PLA2_BH11PLA2_00960 [soil metagenome]